jgi:hypothetical protein
MAIGLDVDIIALGRMKDVLETCGTIQKEVLI